MLTAIRMVVLRQRNVNRPAELGREIPGQSEAQASRLPVQRTNPGDTGKMPVLRVCRLSQGLIQVVAEVLEGFQPDGEPDEIVGDAVGEPGGAVVAGVGHRGRLLDERLHGPEAHRELEQARGFHEALGRGQAL